MTHDVPLVVGIAPSARTKGAKSPQDKAPYLEQLPFAEAMTRLHTTDAHFVTYLPVGMPSGTEFPRCNKTLLGHIRSEGYDLHRTMFALDWDTPEHKPWGETITIAAFEQLFAHAINEFPMLADFACAYYTRSGARLVYILDTPIPVDTSEANIRWFIYQARRAGLMVDELTDWTRLFRLPKVERDGQRTENDPHFDLEMSSGECIKTASLGVASRNDRTNIYAVIEDLDLEMPDFDEVKSLIEVTDDKGKLRPTDWAKTAKRRLTGRECFDCLFNHAPLAQRGARDTTLHAYIGQVVSLLYYLEGTKPEHIFGLFLSPVEQLDNEEGEDWLAILWSGVCRLWAKEDAKDRAREQKREEDSVAKEQAEHSIMDGFRQWAEEDELYSDEFTAKEWVASHLIANIDKSYYIIDNDGYYRPQPFNRDQLTGAIRRHIPDLITTRVERKDGAGMKDVSITEIVNRHATVVNSVVVQPGVDRGYIEGVDKPNARLVVPGFRRNASLEPERDDDVAAWLEKFFGSKVDDGCRWIAFALDWESGPTCALSVEGDQGAGKKLLTQGLAECLETPALATDVDITGDYQYGLLESPFLLVNEGWSKTKGGKHPADRFRELTSGEPIVVQRRFLHPTTIRNPLRVIFTANNLDVIKKLAHQTELSQADREALAIRLMHFSIGGEASDWLRIKGGMNFTAAPGRRWIAPDAGGRSDFVIAKHFLWLYENRHKFWTPCERFLVEGHGSQELMFQLQTQVGPAMLVIELLVRMLNNRKAHQMMQGHGLSIGDKSVFVTSSALLHYWRNSMSEVARGEKLTLNTISSVLSGITLPSKSTNPHTLSHDPKAGRRRWMELDVFKVLDAAERHGFSCTTLDKICKEREVFQKGETVFDKFTEDGGSV